jgi:hypothetical protein
MKILAATDGSKPAGPVVTCAAGLIGRLSPGDHRITQLSGHDNLLPGSVAQRALSTAETPVLRVK